MSGVGDRDVPFELRVSFSASRTVLQVGGEVDVLTAPGLGALLDALVDRSDSDVVIDLRDIHFMDASGLGVIAAASGRLRGSARRLIVASPPPTVRRILELTGMNELIDHDPGHLQRQALGPEQRAGDDSLSVAAVGADPGLPGVGRSMAPQAGTDVIDAALRLVTALARATVGGADGVSVSLTRHGQLTTVAASDETIAQMDRDQYATGEGPCLSAASEGHWFHVESLADEARWPQFIPRAIAGGISSILSTPLVVADRPIGALNIYSSTERAFGPHDQELAALFATQASGILTEARADLTTEKVAQRLREALSGREIIAQAQGVIMGRQGTSADAAYAVLRHSSRQAGITIRQRASAIVDNARHDDLIGQAAG